jgi:hypothetical protein
LPAPDRGFVFARRDGLILITPGRTKMSRSDWRDDELPLRSLIVRESNGEVVSAGFPKFFNAQESGDEREQLSPEAMRLHAALARGADVYFTKKIDGSLCVRSVVDGAVMLRTRGVLAENRHVLAMREVATARYPLLLDPDFAPDVSLLFEFISPDFRIILGYPEADLILLGVVAHADLCLWDVPDTTEFARAHNLHVIDLLALPTTPDALVEAVTALKDQEGVVARCDHGNTLVKLKSASYLAHHRLRFSLSAKTVRSLCDERNVRHIDDFTAYLHEQGADWELMADVRPLVQTYLDAVADADADLARLQTDVAAQLRSVPTPSRKDFALNFAVDLGGKYTAAAFFLFDGRVEDAFSSLRERALDKRFQTLQNEDELRLAALNI